MLGFLDEFIASVAGNVIGGTSSASIELTVLFIISILVTVLLAARLELDLALVIVSPGIILASYVGILPPLAFGVVVLLLGILWAGLIMLLIR